MKKRFWGAFLRTSATVAVATAVALVTSGCGYYGEPYIDIGLGIVGGGDYYYDDGYYYAPGPVEPDAWDLAAGDAAATGS
jgi:hypothetical protein